MISIIEEYGSYEKLPPEHKLAICKNWFNTTYRYKDEKYNRLIILGKLDDDGISPEVKRKELYEEAENVRLEIQRLEEELNNE